MNGHGKNVSDTNSILAENGIAWAGNPGKIRHAPYTLPGHVARADCCVDAGLLPAGGVRDVVARHREGSRRISIPRARRSDSARRAGPDQLRPVRGARLD